MIKLYANILKTIITIGVLLACYFLVSYKYPNFSFLKKKAIQLENTQLIVEESKKIAQLFSAKFYTEIVVDSTKYITVDKIDLKKSILSLSNTSYKDSLKTKIVLLVSGNCYAGNDLNQLEIKKANEEDACKVIIPSAKIFNTVVNPTDFIIFYDGGNWSENEVQQVKSNALTKVRAFALNNGILKKANERTAKLLTDFLKTIGYKKISIEFKNVP